jgi:gamma-glutamyltranspeptidase / glutathione hydrolase
VSGWNCGIQAEAGTGRGSGPGEGRPAWFGAGGASRLRRRRPLAQHLRNTGHISSAALLPTVNRRPFAPCFALLAALAALGASASAEVARGSRGIVSSGHPLATEAGLQVLKNGGNAIDAAVAVALTLGVVDGHNSGIGGGGFMLIRRANGELVALDGRETAPAAATRDMYLRNGNADTSLSQTGALAVGVPGALAMYSRAVRDYGRKPLAGLLLPAARIAGEGFPIDVVYAQKLRATAAVLQRFEGSRAIFLKPDGQPFAAGDVLRQADLARTYRAIAEHGPEWFYGGPFAQTVADWMRRNGGILTVADFKNYVMTSRPPITSTYRGRTIVGFPPPSSGGVHVAQILNMLETFDLAALDPAGERQHVIAEAMKLAFADRAHWLGDPDFADVPRGLLDKDYARLLASRIRVDRTLAVAGHGTPPDADPRFFGRHTTHFSVADAEGNWVACTQTINTAFGSKVVVPGTGVLLNNEMDDFSIQPGVPNAFKLVGAEANAIAPGKRPLSSMSPTIVLQNGQPILAIGAAGGPTIISQTVLNLVALIDFGQPLEVTLAQPRLHHQWRPDELRIEQALPADVRAGLAKRGHTFNEETNYGVSHAVGRSSDGREFVGAADRRAGGKAAGW